MSIIKKTKLLFFFLLISNVLFSQETIDKVNYIDSIISKNNNTEKPELTSASGILKKKVLGIFNKKIGGINWTINSIDNKINSIVISKYYPKKEKEIIVKYFYNNALFIKYVSYSIKYSKNNQSDIINKNILYFENNNMIKNEGVFNSNPEIKIKEIIVESKVEFTEWSLFIQNH